MINEIILKRLSIVKLLYNLGLEQSDNQSEYIAAFSTLTFHDSIEMFLKLACDYKQIKSDKLSFIDYWEVLPSLTLKESMRNNNTRRVNLKHKGLLPAKIEIETSKINTIDFFQQNTKEIFGIEFNEISLLELIKFKNVKSLLTSAQKNLIDNNYEGSFLNSIEAFEELLIEYKANKINGFKGNLFDFPNNIKIDRYSGSGKETGKDKRLDDVVRAINDKFTHLEKALEIISFDFNFRKYSKFKLLSPHAYKEVSTGKYQFYNYNNRIKFTKSNCEFGIDFVIECCLKLQDFDYENPNFSIIKL